MANFDYRQPILGTSKRNPVFSVHRHRMTGDYHVYYGLELFEAVPCDDENPQSKLMLAHVHNTGVTLMKLQEVFGIDPRTILNWSRALKSGSAEKLSQALDCGKNWGVCSCSTETRKTKGGRGPEKSRMPNRFVTRTRQ